jgi:mannose-6-phosphate isomerase
MVAAAARAGAGDPRYELLRELAIAYPGDPGVVLALLLNRVRLHPGEAIFMPAGNLHAYLRGVGIEVMAASDNVLRGGLTPKHVDVEELLRILRYEVLKDPVVHPVEVAPGVVTWPVPVPDFALYRAQVAGAPVEIPGDGPRVVLCLRGEVTADDGVAPLTLRSAGAAFVEAGTKPLVVSGAGELYEATVG